MSAQTRPVLCTILTAGVLLALAPPTLAQRPAPAGAPPGAAGGSGFAGRGTPGPSGPQGGARRGRGLSLAAIPVSVLEMITPLKAEQKKKIIVVESKWNADMKTASRETRGAISAKASEDVKAILTPAQAADVQKAVPELLIMRRILPVGALEDVKLTRPQFTKIMGFTSSVVAQNKGLQGQQMWARMQQVTPQLKMQIESVLTAAQKSALAKYEAAHPPRQRGGPGGPGAPGGPGVAAAPGPGAAGRPVR